MNKMQLSCPKCKTNDVRIGNPRGLVELIKGLVGIFPLLCRRCSHRWTTSTRDRYAQCPRCYRQDLSTWSELYDRGSRWTIVLLRMGAVPYACQSCGHLFAGFKACKDRFMWRQQPAVGPPQAAAASARTKALAAQVGSATARVVEVR